MIGDLGVEMVALNAFMEATAGTRSTDPGRAMHATGQLVVAMGADLGLVMDNAAERVWLIDELGQPIDAETTLLLLLRELAGSTDSGALLVPITETALVERVTGDAAVRVRRTKASLQSLLAAAAEDDVVFAGASGGGYVFPAFLPAYDAVMSIGKVLEVVAHSGRTLSALVADLPSSTLIRRSVDCPWSLKGVAMRRLIESVKGLEVDNMDGIKVFEDEGWAQVIPDPDEPVFHIWAEGDTEQDSERLERKYRELLEGIVSSEPAGAPTLN